MKTNKDWLKPGSLVLPLFVMCVQIISLFLLRQIALRTVFQTVIFYAVLCAVGILICLVTDKWKQWRLLRDAYIVCLSGVQGTIILSFFTWGAYYLTLTQVTAVELVNLFFGMVLYWVAYVIAGSASKAIGIGNMLIGIMGTVNHYLVRFRGAPFSKEDFKAIGTAANVVSNYNFTPDLLLCVLLLFLVIWYFVWRVYFGNTRRYHKGHLIGSLAVLLGIVFLVLIRFDKLYDETTVFSKDSDLVELVMSFRGGKEQLPEDYSVEAVANFIEELQLEEEQLSGEEKLPNILVIMNEAFSDLRVLGDFETNMPVTPFLDSLMGNCTTGWANVSVFGGTTANSEYELLTSDAVGIFNGVVPYNQYFTRTQKYPGLTSWFNQLGYTTMAFHPYLSNGWNRPFVYQSMQFDRTIFGEDLDGEQETIRLYVSDEENYSVIQELFEQKGEEPLFLFNITMQNHGGYTYSGEDFETSVRLMGEASGKFPETEQYLSLIHESDRALQGLLTYLQSLEEEVIVLFYGDHQPRLEDEFYEYFTGKRLDQWEVEETMNLFKTPFFIWSNRENNGDFLGDVSVNFLGSILLREAGLPLNEYQQFVLNEYEKYPVVNSLAVVDRTGNRYARGSLAYSEMTSQYRLVMINHTIDIDNRIAEFFE